MDERRNSSSRLMMPVWRSGLLVAMAVSGTLLGLASCADAGDAQDARFADDALAADEAAATGGAAPMTSLGAFLSGRVAQDDRDYGTALAFFREALSRAPDSVEL